MNMTKKKRLDYQRKKLVTSLEQVLEGPMIFLGFVWLVLLVLELVRGLSQALTHLSTVIWVVFIIDFAIKFVVAPDKLSFLRTNWLTAISLLVPALRLFKIVRVLRFARLFRGARLIKVVASINRGMKSLNATMQRRGFAYVMMLTVCVILAGAAGMLAFENAPNGITSYSSALWWTTMVIITVGSDYWPETTEGRALCILLAVYGFAIFGYITATISSFFIGRDAEEKDAPIASSAEIQSLRREIVEMKALLNEIKKSAHDNERQTLGRSGFRVRMKKKVRASVECPLSLFAPAEHVNKLVVRRIDRRL